MLSGDRMLGHGTSVTSSLLTMPGPGPAWTLQPPQTRAAPHPQAVVSPSTSSQDEPLQTPPSSSLPRLHLLVWQSKLSFGFAKGWWALVSVLTDRRSHRGGDI